MKYADAALHMYSTLQVLIVFVFLTLHVYYCTIPLVYLLLLLLSASNQSEWSHSTGMLSFWGWDNLHPEWIGLATINK